MESTRTIRKWFWVWSFDREEAWLNDMAMNGWVLSSVDFCTYHFTRCEPGEYTVRLEMHPSDEAYVRSTESTGAEYVGRMIMWMYFRRKSAFGPFDLLQDTDRRTAHLNRISTMLAFIGCGNLMIGLSHTLSGSSGFGWMNLLCAALLMYALGRIHGKKEALEKERFLQE